MNATPQTIQVERELAHHIRWTIAKLVPDVFGERKDRGMNISGEHITISWLGSGEEETPTLVHDGDDTFIQDFSEAGSDTITDFNPAFDTIDFRGLGGVDSISVSEVDGGTLISADEDKSLFVRNTSPEEFSGNIKINGEPVEGNGQFELESTLTNAASTDADTAIGSALDAVTEQGGAVADDGDDIDSDATLTIDDIIEDAEGQGDEDQSGGVG